MNNTRDCYSPKQGRLPLFLADFLDICDPVLAFDKVMEESGIEKYLRPEPFYKLGRPGYNRVSMLKTVIPKRAMTPLFDSAFFHNPVVPIHAGIVIDIISHDKIPRFSVANRAVRVDKVQNLRPVLDDPVGDKLFIVAVDGTIGGVVSSTSVTSPLLNSYLIFMKKPLFRFGMEALHEQRKEAIGNHTAVQMESLRSGIAVLFVLVKLFCNTCG